MSIKELNEIWQDHLKRMKTIREFNEKNEKAGLLDHILKPTEEPEKEWHCWDNFYRSEDE